MRDIKFRAWLKNVGIMLSVYVLDQTGNAGRGSHFEKSKGYTEHGAQFVFNIDDAELMQFTGIVDKNSVEIFEGDRVTDGEHIWDVVFIDGCFWLRRPNFNTANDMRSWPANCYPMFRVNHSLYSTVVGHIYQ